MVERWVRRTEVMVEHLAEPGLVHIAIVDDVVLRDQPSNLAAVSHRCSFESNQRKTHIVTHTANDLRLMCCSNLVSCRRAALLAGEKLVEHAHAAMRGQYGQ